MTEEIYWYLDDLLRLQSDAAERHNHAGVLGAVREEFVIQVLNGRIDNIRDNLHRGEVVATAGDMGQQDVIIRRRGSINPALGGHVRITTADCVAVIEIKSNAKATEITDFNRKSAQIKADNPAIICGMVCYKLANKKSTILKRMGIVCDTDDEAFVEDTSLTLEYQNIDFIFCLDEDLEETGGFEYSKEFFIKKNSSGRYNLFIDPPYMKYFLLEVNSVANPGVAA